MSTLKSIALAFLLATPTLAFQPLHRPASAISRAAPVTVLSAFKTKSQLTDVANFTEATTLTATEFLKLESPASNGALFQELEEQEPETSLEQSPLEGLLWKGSVVVLCALWASNFPVAKLIMAEPGVDSSLYAVTRFSVAALALAPGAIASTRRTGMDWDTIKGAVICGSWVAFGYLGQTLGLLTTTASKSCVICSLHCVFVAAIAEWLRVQKANENNTAIAPNSSTTQYDFKRLIPAAIAVAGVAIVELKGGAGGANIGDALSFAQPIGFGLGYLILEDLMSKRPDTALAVSAIKLSVVALASLVMYEVTPLVKEGVDNWSFSLPDFSAVLASPVAMRGVLYTGLVTTALALWVESIAFARVSAKDASLILTTEPLFAAGLGAVALGETFGLSDYAGASLIIGACVLATLMDDENRDENCDPTDDDECEVPRQVPFAGR
jgi:drug/metabolite transporter (DMT)-like permease